LLLSTALERLKTGHRAGPGLELLFAPPEDAGLTAAITLEVVTVEESNLPCSYHDHQN
jgi:hypothetical protein